MGLVVNIRVGVGIILGECFKCGYDGGKVRRGRVIWDGLDCEYAVSNAEVLQVLQFVLQEKFKDYNPL